MKVKIFVALVAIFGAVTAAPSQNQGRIVGGVDASDGEYPYIVSFRKYGSHACGGSILDSTHVLTAAHCVAGSENNPSSLSIRYGTVDSKGQDNIVNVEEVIRHADYTPGNGYPNDVAILVLKEEIEFGPKAYPVILPESSDYPGDNADAVLVGWGARYTGAGVEPLLQKVNITLFTDEICGSQESDYNPNWHVCAGIPGGGKGQCSGDSGGPLTVNGVQFGIVSWSVKPCTSPNHPGIYAKVTQYREWIRENSGV